ncbi:MAG: bifunctional (p)ppGpp synthetase/guanosine-3',5'-bis(diphosphate) 3'-pyrophosphohydrolase [Methylobacterium sp.]|nr:bifunctional (p)ppGpp synthetase/guanosine-3',5'-bis(diphosphate) 3'-pyrophosphohydrolase [Methylobacterium sp.]MCA3605515.1 bifunctional (p)ppGpp synthetase/guanosine-3',5'-bis(diphosphate) 3'-pyrophosphohydrolase [Methylobacterium sp.]MCA3608292.1 bifunctional (p)ppGpp synthetase/guanosine-3',5'-bis(diphosphate) 3'-pyrophosphohydrolase [Methylobacterium sp.]MCA3612224.1 bifunctional (p)ppGpp synthetase/guanosine-3',5'-bis(diphosphate) 3'-pyrophosphohydrolase [Methylobacterium sp.]MCA361819
MMRQYELVERVKRYNPRADEDLLNRAYVYAMKAHGTQKRASGDPYFSHPLEVAAILTELRVDDETIAAAMLHDTIEDTETTRTDIESRFGADIATLVEGLTKIKKLDLVSKKAAQAENLRKMLLAVAEDARVLLVKLADRLHNMRTLHYVPPDKRARIAEETLEIYAPLAGRIGMQEMREELEEICFRVLMPDAHMMVMQRLEAFRSRAGPIIAFIENDLRGKLAANGIEGDVKGREKRPYSIWRKMERKSVSFEQLPDILGFRVMVGNIPDCYRMLGIVHNAWPFVPGRFKDYISTPKQNDYRSIHTTVVGPKHQRVELQIRTQAMDEIAEYGIAAHALYKDQSVAERDAVLGKEARAYNWLRRTIETLAEGDNPEEFIEHTKLELFHDQVFCFTPKGLLITLPRSATPIDFAYAVHTDVGNHAVGCRINGRNAPLTSELRNGDEVEILTSEAQVPPPAWESLVVTGKARSSIRRATREAVRKQFAGLGRRIIERAFERMGKPQSEEKLASVVRRLARPGLEDVYAAVGRGELHSGDVVKAVFPDFKEETPKTAAGLNGAGWFGVQGADEVKFKVPGKEGGASALPIRGLSDDLPVRFAPGGGPVPGERIVGILTPGEGITIYPIQSPSLSAFDEEPWRWLDVRWDVEEGERRRYPARLIVSVINEPGSLAEVARVMAETDANIDNIEMRSKTKDFREMLFDIEVWNIKHLTAIITDLKAKPMIANVERVVG